MANTLSLVAGVALGWVLAVVTMRQAFRLAATYQRTGKPDAPAPVDAARVPTVSSPEASANRMILDDAVQNGADQIVQAAEASGVHLTRNEAELQARQMLSDNAPLGGVR